MRNRPLTVILIAAAVASASCHKPQADSQLGPEQHFSLWLEHSAAGWAAHCDSGCSWKDVTLKCVNCKVLIDADGIAGDAVATPPRGFAFIVDDHNGLSAHGVRGVRWIDLSWGCASAVCRAQLSEEGVHVPT